MHRNPASRAGFRVFRGRRPGRRGARWATDRATPRPGGDGRGPRAKLRGSGGSAEGGSKRWRFPWHGESPPGWWHGHSRAVRRWLGGGSAQGGWRGARLPRPWDRGDYLRFAIAVAIYPFGTTSGAHINPAVTVSLAATGRFPWGEVPAYVVAQLVGATAGAALIVAAFGGDAVDFGTGGTTLADDVTYVQGIVAEAIGTFLLVTAVMALAVDSRAPGGSAGFMIGPAVAAAILVIDPLTGASLNPARTRSATGHDDRRRRHGMGRPAPLHRRTSGGWRTRGLRIRHDRAPTRGRGGAGADRRRRACGGTGRDTPSCR
jgi:hypothetical protein